MSDIAAAVSCLSCRYAVAKTSQGASTRPTRTPEHGLQGGSPYSFASLSDAPNFDSICVPQPPHPHDTATSTHQILIHFVRPNLHIHMTQQPARTSGACMRDIAVAMLPHAASFGVTSAVSS
eukprot:356298-Chlamydomonas_euryale.AAC.7